MVPVVMRTIAVAALASAVSLIPAAGQAASFTVPSVATPTIFDAIAAAELSLDVVNTIEISSSPLTVGATVTFGAAFGPTRQLVVRPVASHQRATIVSTALGVPIVRFTGGGGGGYVTLQDLDLVRNITNNANLVEISFCNNVLIDRCRIGSNWSSTGAAGFSHVFIEYPTAVVIRNSVCFARIAGTLDYGIRAINMNDPRNSLFLYNNVVADYRTAGIRINDGAGPAGVFLLLRNNVAVNHLSLAPEPTAYVSEVDGATTVVSSHNTAFASAGLGEALVGAATSIAGTASAYLLFARGAAPAAFMTMNWTPAPPWDANPSFFHLTAAGPLHDGPAKYGQTVMDGAPHPRDIAVARDIDREVRPGGAAPGHTDRGVDQLDPGTVAAHVGERAETAGAAILDAAPLANPGPSVAIRSSARVAGRVSFEVFDLAGRRVHQSARLVGRGDENVFEFRPAGAAGCYLYRLEFRGGDGSTATASGKVMTLR